MRKVIVGILMLIIFAFAWGVATINYSLGGLFALVYWVTAFGIIRVAVALLGSSNTTPRQRADALAYSKIESDDTSTDDNVFQYRRNRYDREKYIEARLLDIAAEKYSIREQYTLVRRYEARTKANPSNILAQLERDARVISYNTNCQQVIQENQPPKEPRK